MNQISKVLSVSAVTFLLAACGGNGTSDIIDSATSAQKPVTINGQVQQGNIAGATVFLDLNGNGVQDAGEPAAPATVADGKFKLDLTADRATALKAAGTTAKIVS